MQPEERGERGAVTAEAAIVMPILIVFAVGLAWLVSLGVTQVRSVDAAREVARSVARGEQGSGVSLGKRVAPTGSAIAVRRSGETVVVSVAAPVRGPGGLFGFLPTFTVHAEAVAAMEPTQ